MPLLSRSATINAPAGRVFGYVDSYEMRVLVEPDTDTTARLTITIDYALPRKGLWRYLGRVLAAPYARWCLGSMIEGTVQELAGGPT